MHFDTPKSPFAKRASLILLCAGVLLLAMPARSQKVKIDTASARAVLAALNNPNLTLDQAMTIARLEGNQGMIKEMHDLEEADTAEQFAGALLATAHGRAPESPQEAHYNFDAVKASTAPIALLLNQVEGGFDKDIGDRIRPYVANPDKVSIRGFVVAGGDGGGYAFGGSEFYLNIALNDDIMMAKQVMVHEAFHGAQGAVYREDTEHWAKERTQPENLARGKFCSDTATLFADMRNEGTAMYVGTDEMIKDAKGPTGQRLYAESLYGREHLADSAGLLELSIASLQAPHPVSYKLVYSIDFFGRGIVYYISRAMAGAIAEQDGPSAVGEVLLQPGYEFVLRYTRLRSYGKDRAHPHLGENTLRAAQSLHDGCPAS